MSKENAVQAVAVNEKTPKRAWAVLGVVYFASIMAPLIQMKVPALSSWLFPAFQLDAATFGMLMSALSIIGFILAFPAAFIIRKIGLKMSMIISIAALGLGAALGAVSVSIPMLLAGRFIEGIGLGLIGVVGPSCLSVWFPKKTRGFALGVWATWIPLGSIIVFNTAPSIAASMNNDWRIVFWICTALCAVALILFAIVYTDPPEADEGEMGVQGSMKDAMKVLKNPYIWILGLVFLFFNGIAVGISSSYYNTFLEQALGFSAIDATRLTGLNMVLPLVAAPAIGALSDRLPDNKKKYLITASMVLILLATPFIFNTGEYAMISVWIWFWALGLVGGFGAGSCRPMAPIVMGGSALGATMGMAVLQFCQNLGQAICSPLFGTILDATGNWSFSFMVLTFPMIGVATILSLFITRKNKHNS